MNPKSILAHVTLYNSKDTVIKTIESLLAQKLPATYSLTVLVTDNASEDNLLDQLTSINGDKITYHKNSVNLGFAAAQNQAARVCLRDGFSYLFLVNPDLRLEPDAVSHMLQALEGEHRIGMVTPLLIKADENLNQLSPATVDAAGMYMTTSLRHLDRVEKITEYNNAKNELVFGGTGAALLMTTQFIKDVTIDDTDRSEGLFIVYPQLREGYLNRVQLFDEAFFAYREDADLAWRAQLLGWQTIFVPAAIGYHIRHVTPENRSKLSPLINRYSVRNRFLLQLNNYTLNGMWHCLIPGLIIRNLLVVIGVILKEQSSIVAFSELKTLFWRAWYRRKILFCRARPDLRAVGRWFT
jgi:GT2 family glycosyltransferase